MSSDWSVVREVLAWITGIAAVVVSAVAATHVILHKRDVRAAIGWTGVILVSPFVGAAAYYLLGINRIHRKAARITGGRVHGPVPQPVEHDQPPPVVGESLVRLARMVGTTSGAPLTFHNRIDPLIDGDLAYPAMIRAIGSAERSVILLTYIFDDDAAGREFVDALAEAVRRGVEVRVLVDDVGSRYSRPPITRRLRRLGVPVRSFMPTRFPWPNPYVNLRNHRKILVIDRRIGFAGGMNIREGCLLRRQSPSPVRDLHFRIDGPVVEHLFAAAAEDWAFTAGERLSGPAWDPPARADERPGVVAARGVPDGPDEHFETITWTMLAAIDVARRSIRILTPYFLPETPLITALRLAALRGVDVEILLPARGNLRVVQWASRAQLWQVLQPGCRVLLTPPPFDHSKLMIVDEAWSLIGSANMDPRSLRLNFEFGVECYDEALAARLLETIDAKSRDARPLTLADVDSRPLPTRIRDGVARLFLPYL